MKYLRLPVRVWETTGRHINMHNCIFRLHFSYPVADHYQPWGKMRRRRRGNKNKKRTLFAALLFSVSSALKESHPVSIIGNIQRKVRNNVYS